MATSNINLEEIALSQTFGEWLEAFNDNMGIIDELPIPIEYGSNTTMEYLKLSNGKVIMWGRIDHGANYPCNTPSLSNYASAMFTIDFPISLTSTTPMVVGTPQGNAGSWADLWFLLKEVTYTSLSGYYLCPSNDSGRAGTKSLNILIIGDWK